MRLDWMAITLSLTFMTATFAQTAEHHPVFIFGDGLVSCSEFLQEQICGMCKILRLGIPRIRSAGWHGLKTIAGHTHERSFLTPCSLSEIS